MSIITYPAGLKYMPEKNIKEINSDLWKFLWSGKSEPVKRTICAQTTDDGGIGMPDLAGVVKTRQIMTVNRILQEGDEKWKEIPNKYLKSLDGKYNEEYFLLNAYLPPEKLTELQMPVFYRECIRSWQDMKSKIKDPELKEEVYNERLWLNPKIQIDGKPIDNVIWSRYGIQKVHDIYDEHGEIRKDYIKHKVKSGDTVLMINKIISAIPQKWKTIFKSLNVDEHLDRREKENTVLHQMNSKNVYNLINIRHGKTRWQTEWEGHFGQIQWKKVYNIRQNKLIERKVLDMQWKSLNYGLCTEEKQKKMRLSDGFCKLCSIEVETIEHLFYECELVENIWAIISDITTEIWNEKADSLKSVIFGQIQKEIDHDISQILEFIIISTKWIIWKRRNKLKYDEKWTNIDETVKWVKAYITEQTELLLKTRLKLNKRQDLMKLLEKTRNN